MDAKKSLCLFSALALTLAGCGGGGGGGDTPRTGGTETGGTKTAATTGTSSIRGSVTFVGDAPKTKPIKMDADPFCHTQHPDGGGTPDVVVNSNGTLKWVFVYIKGGLSGSYSPPAEPVVLDQKGCTYEPHVFGIMAGQSLDILNSDDTLHNIHALPSNSSQFNLAMPRAGMKISKKFKASEVMVRIKCDVHPWMETWAGVVDHPYHAVTGDQGSFSLDGLPAGSYVVEAWHEEYGAQTQNVTVGDGESQEISFTFKPQA